MLWIVVSQRLDVDRDDLTRAEQVAYRGEEERASAAVRPGLDDQLGSRLGHDLLVDPEIEWILERLSAEPGRLRPGVRRVEDVMRALDRRPVQPSVNAEACSRQSSLDVVLHGGAILGVQSQHFEVPIGDARDRWHRDCVSTLVEFYDEPVEDTGDLLVRDESEPSVAHELGMPAARPDRRRAVRMRAPRAARSSMDRRSWAPGRRRARGAAARPRRDATGPTTRTRSKSLGPRPTNVSS